jgi:hypothetical protein
MQIHREYFRACTVLMGLSFIGGLLWSICSITVSQEKAQVVAGVGIIGISGIGGTWSFIAYLLWGARRVDPDVLRINVRERPNITDVVMIGTVYEGDIINIATGLNTPIKIVVFEPHSPIKDQAMQL